MQRMRPPPGDTELQCCARDLRWGCGARGELWGGLVGGAGGRGVGSGSGGVGGGVWGQLSGVRRSGDTWDSLWS